MLWLYATIAPHSEEVPGVWTSVILKDSPAVKVCFDIVDLLTRVWCPLEAASKACPLKWTSYSHTAPVLGGVRVALQNFRLHAPLPQTSGLDYPVTREPM